MREHANKEFKTASNIKNKNVGKAVKEAWRSIIYKLKILNELPTNGLTICAGRYKLPKGGKNQYCL